ncbi:MAG: hypothetical protein ACI4JA_05885 [Oscillospiraceae bacterium]
MTEQQYIQILEQILNEIKDAKLEAKILNSDDGTLLRAIVPLGNSEDDLTALADIGIVTTANGTEIAQIYFTLTAELSDNAEAEIIKALPALNFYSLIGSYGIYDHNQVYFKYAIPISEFDDNELRASEILDAFAVSFESLSGTYDAIIALASGTMDYSTAVKSELIPEM